MLKLILMSVALTTIILPLAAASDPNPKKGLKRAVFGFFAFNVFYIFLLRVVVPRLG